MKSIRHVEKLKEDSILDWCNDVGSNFFLRVQHCLPYKNKLLSCDTGNLNHP